jgi:hypothetical protein
MSDFFRFGLTLFCFFPAGCSSVVGGRLGSGSETSGAGGGVGGIIGGCIGGGGVDADGGAGMLISFPVAEPVIITALSALIIRASAISPLTFSFMTFPISISDMLLYITPNGVIFRR